MVFKSVYVCVVLSVTLYQLTVFLNAQLVHQAFAEVMLHAVHSTITTQIIK